MSFKIFRFVTGSRCICRSAPSWPGIELHLVRSPARHPLSYGVSIFSSPPPLSSIRLRCDISVSSATARPFVRGDVHLVPSVGLREPDVFRQRLGKACVCRGHGVMCGFLKFLHHHFTLSLSLSHALTLDTHTHTHTRVSL